MARFLPTEKIVSGHLVIWFSDRLCKGLDEKTANKQDILRRFVYEVFYTAQTTLPCFLRAFAGSVDYREISREIARQFIRTERCPMGPTEFDFREIKVLIVNDSRSMRAIVRSILMQLGCAFADDGNFR